MDINEIKQIVKEKLSKTRYEHTIRVYDTAIRLANQYQVSVQKVSVAALLHDYAKCQTKEELINNINKYALPQDLLSFHHELWHGPVAAAIAAHEYGISDDSILNAIRYHTTGEEEMDMVGLVIFVADYMEPARQFPGVEEVRDLANKDLQQAARKALQNTIIFLMKKGVTIYPDTFFAYNALTNTLKE